MARLFSNSEYTDIVLVYGEVCASAPRARRISVGLLLLGVDEGMLERVVEYFVAVFIIVLTIMAVTLNTSYND
jgi:hypothetical protein